jgi:HSP20 family protein
MPALIPFNHRNAMMRTPGFDAFNDMIDDFFNGGPMAVRSLARDTFKVDVEETDDAYDITAELPGVAKDEIDIEVNDEGQLTIAVNREESTNDEGKNYIHKERRTESMARSIYLGDADPAGISAKLADGILSLQVPKKSKAQRATKVTIQ